MKRICNLCVVIVMAIFVISCQNKNLKMEKELTGFISRYDAVVIPLVKSMNLAYWEASLTGNEQAFKKYETLSNQMVTILSNKDDFKKLEEIKASGAITDSLLARQLNTLYISFLANQVDTNLLKEINKMESAIEQKFNTFRAEANGKKLSDNEIEDILSVSTNSNELENAWKAHKKIGLVVAPDIIALVKKRNEQAHQLGFANYHTMSLKLSEQDPEQIENLFDELDSLTRGSFVKAKDDVDTYLATRLKMSKTDLMPWHYQNRFFQEAPKIYPIDLDKYYKDKNLEKLTASYYNSIGLDISDLIAKSDLYEKPGKSQHAFCADMDNEGDVRVLCNLKSNSYWMNTMLHEFGHASYDKYIDTTLPFMLREPAHIFTTEAIAMMFGRLSSNPQQIQDLCGISDKEKAAIADNCYKTLRLEQLVFSRWAQVMYRFEKSMYANPDQDLNAMWWKLVEKYQMIQKPAGRNEPDWASKIHIATSPCYYHNYLLGELLASQLHFYICKNIVKDTSNINMVNYYNHPDVGKYLDQQVFKPGSRYFWNEMIERATGEKLTSKYYAKQFVN